MRRTLWAVVGALMAAGLVPVPVEAGCGCDKPPPTRAAVRPFVGHAGERITLFSEELVEGEHYRVEFTSAVGDVTDWSAGRARRKRDLADGEVRTQLRIAVPDVPFGPVRLSIAGRSGTVLRLPDSAFTVTTEPLPLHEFAETITRTDYQAGVGRDGTLYIPVDVRDVSSATSFVAQGQGYKLAFGPGDVVMYNEQGFLMQVLDPGAPGLFDVAPGVDDTSHALAYWRHEFQTYKQEHRRVRDRGLAEDDDWHEDGSRHVDHDRIVVAIRGTLVGGQRPTPGATPPFTLVVSSTPDDR
jgi:hypothetical protein